MLELLLIFVMALNSDCPIPVNWTKPCICSLDSKSKMHLVCNGSQIKDLSNVLADSIADGDLKFGKLEITDTSITFLDSEAFKDATFEEISIENNTHLTGIDPNAFHKSAQVRSISEFDLLNSPNVESSKQLFPLLSDLNVKRKIYSEKLGVQMIPDFAFKKNSQISELIIRENLIKKVEKSAFSGFSNLTFMMLSKNLISEIDSNGLTLELDHDKNVMISLDDNHLTENSFHENWSSSKCGKNKIQ